MALSDFVSPGGFRYTDDPRKYLAKVLVRCRGNMHKAAHELGICRKQIYNLVNAYYLWPLVNAARIEYAEEKKKEKK